MVNSVGAALVTIGRSVSFLTDRATPHIEYWETDADSDSNAFADADAFADVGDGAVLRDSTVGEVADTATANGPATISALASPGHRAEVECRSMRGATATAALAVDGTGAEGGERGSWGSDVPLRRVICDRQMTTVIYEFSSLPLN